MAKKLKLKSIKKILNKAGNKISDLDETIEDGVTSLANSAVNNAQQLINQAAELTAAQVSKSLDTLTVEQIRSLKDVQLGAVTPEQIYKYAKSFTDLQLEMLMTGLSKGLFAPQLGGVVGFVANATPAIFLSSGSTVSSFAGAIDGALAARKKNGNKVSLPPSSTTSTSNSDQGSLPTVNGFRRIDLSPEASGLMASISNELAAGFNVKIDAPGSSIQGKLQKYQYKNTAAINSLLSNLGKLNLLPTNSKYGSKAQTEGAKDFGAFINLAFAASAFANLSSAQNPLDKALYTLTGSSALVSGLEKTLQTRIDVSNKAKLVKVENNWKDSQALADPKYTAKSKAAELKRVKAEADTLKLRLSISKNTIGLGAQALALYNAISTLNTNDPASIANFSAVVAGATSQALNSFADALKAAKYTQIATAAATAANVVNILSAAALLGMAVAEYKKGKPADKLVASLAIADASIQMAFAATQCMVSVVPGAGQGVAEALALANTLMPSLTGMYTTEQLAKSFTTLYMNGLKNDALMVEAAYDIAFTQNLALTGIFSSQITERFNNLALDIIKDNSGWFRQTEQQRLQFALNSGSMSKTLNNLAAIAQSLGADSAEMLYLSNDKFEYLSGKQKYKSSIQSVSSIYIDNKASSINIADAVVNLGTNELTNKTLNANISSEADKTKFVTFAAADGAKDSLIVNASGSKGRNVYQLSVPNVTIYGGSGVETYWIDDAVASNTEIVANSNNVNIYCQSNNQDKYSYTKDKTKFGLISIDKFTVSNADMYSPMVYGSNVGEFVTGTLDDQKYSAASNYDQVNLKGKAAMVSVGTGGLVELKGAGSSAYVDMNMTGSLNLTADSLMGKSPTVVASYGDSLLSIATTDQIAMRNNAQSDSVSVGSTNVLYTNGVFDLQYLPVAATSTGSSISATGFNYFQGSFGNDYYSISDQSAISESNRLKAILTGKGNNVIEIFDKSGSLNVELGTGINYVQLHQGATSVVSTSFDLERASKGLAGNVSTIALESFSALVGNMNGNESILAASDTSSMYLNLGQGTHYITTSGSAMYADIQNSNSTTIINNLDSDTSTYSTDIIDLSAFSTDKLYSYWDANGSLEVTAFSDTSTADILLVGDLNRYAITAFDGTKDVSISVGSLLQSMAAAPASGAATSRNFNGNMMTQVNSYLNLASAH